MASDPSLKKNYSGTFTDGQGPILGMHSSSEPEFSGVHGGEGKEDYKKTVDQGGHDSKPTGESENFDLHGKSYAGPENWIPENKGVVNPDNVSSSFGVKTG